jgi:hypothetical protein
MSSRSTGSITGSAALAARPTSQGFGKCTAPLKTLVPDEAKDDFIRRARELGYGSDSDALRELVFIFTYGADHLAKVHTDRITRVAGNMAGIGPET